MANKHKGSNAERELVHLFWSKGWGCIRVAGSGSSRYPSPDLLVGKPGRKFAIECKATKANKKYFPDEEIEALQSFSTSFGAEPWVAIKFARTEWLFFSIEDLDKTPGSFCISLEKAKQKGILIEELVKELTSTV